MSVNSFLKNLFGLNRNDQEFGSFEDQNRVFWEPSPVRPGETVQIKYQGLLKDAGADEVYLHYGFDSWSYSVNTIKMERLENGNFGAGIQATGNQEINFCFKDSAGNWDNNNGWNWRLQLQ